MIVLGIDPGQTGGFAAVRMDNGFPFVLGATMPILFQPRSKPTLDAIRMDEWLAQYRFDVAVIEEVNAMPKQGVASSFQFGRMFGSAENMMMIYGTRFEYVPPGKWKRDMGLTSEKRKSLDLATAKFGNETREAYWPLKKHEGVAEAALLALWWLERNA